MTPSFSAEMRFLLQASYTGVLRQNQLECTTQVSRPNQGLDWSCLHQLVLRHRVANHMTAGVGKGVLHPKESAGLRRMTQRLAMRTLQQVGELQRVQSAFKAHNIPLLMLKGTEMSRHLFGSDAFRTCSDIDFLVSAENLLASQNLLLACGYGLTNHQKPFTEQNISYLLNAAAIHLAFHHPKHGVVIELHWRLFVDTHLLSLTEQDRMVLRAFGRCHHGQIAMLVDEDLLLYLCLHGALHGWFRLHWLLDIAALVLRDSIDWAAWCLRVQALRLERPVVQAFALLHKLFGMTLPVALERLISAEKNTDQLLGIVYQGWSNDHPTHLSARMQRGLLARPMLKSDPYFLYDQLRRLWQNPLTWPFPNLPRWLFPINFPLGAISKATRIITKQ